MNYSRIVQYIASNYALAFLGFLVSLLTTKFVGPEYFGYVAKIMLYSDWVHIIILLGLDQSFLRYGMSWSNKRKNEFISELFIILLIVFALFCLVYFIFALNFVFLLIAINSFILAISRLLIVYFRVNDSLTKLNLLTTLGLLVTKVVTVILFVNDFTVPMVVFFAIVLNGLLLLPFLKKIVFTIKFRINPLIFNKTFLFYGLLALVSTIFYVFIIGFPVFYLDQKGSVETLGLFNLSVAVVSLLNLGLNGLKTVFPLIIYKEDKSYLESVGFLHLLAFLCLSFLILNSLLIPVLLTYIDEKYFGILDYMNLIVLITLNTTVLELFAFNYNKHFKQLLLIIENIAFFIILIVLFMMNMSSKNTIFLYTCLMAFFAIYRSYVLFGLNWAFLQRLLVLSLFNSIMLFDYIFNAFTGYLLWLTSLTFIFYRYGSNFRLWFRQFKFRF